MANQEINAIRDGYARQLRRNISARISAAKTKAKTRNCFPFTLIIINEPKWQSSECNEVQMTKGKQRFVPATLTWLQRSGGSTDLVMKLFCVLPGSRLGASVNSVTAQRRLESDSRTNCSCITACGKIRRKRANSSR
jgi:hypothetical protein